VKGHSAKFGDLAGEYSLHSYRNGWTFSRAPRGVTHGWMYNWTKEWYYKMILQSFLRLHLWNPRRRRSGLGCGAPGARGIVFDVKFCFSAPKSPLNNFRFTLFDLVWKTHGEDVQVWVAVHQVLGGSFLTWNSASAPQKTPLTIFGSPFSILFGKPTEKTFRSRVRRTRCPGVFADAIFECSHPKNPRAPSFFPCPLEFWESPTEKTFEARVRRTRCSEGRFRRGIVI